MKKLLLALSVCCVLQNANAQLHEVLKETNWFVGHVVLNGVNYPTPLVNVIGIVDPNIVFTETMAFAVIDPESDSFFSDITYDPNEFEFTFINPTITLPGCQAYCDFAQVYFEFLFGDGMEVPFTYEIIVTDAVSHFLIITDEVGNQAFYQDTPILGTDDLVRSSTVVYPNPVSDMLFIVADGAALENVVIFNSIGQMILEEVVNLNQVNVSALESGLYFIEITSEEEKTVRKFIKQ